MNQSNLFHTDYTIHARYRRGKWKLLGKFDSFRQARANLFFRMEENPFYFIGHVRTADGSIVYRVHTTGEP